MTIDSRREGGIVWNIVTGPLDAAYVIDFVKENLAGWKQDPVIWDLTECSLADVNATEWRSILPALRDIAEVRRGARAAIVSRSEFHFGMLKMLEFIARIIDYPSSVRAFQDKEEAVAWIRS